MEKENLRDIPADGVMIDTKCVRTDFDNNDTFNQSDLTDAHISVSLELGTFSIRDMNSNVMLSVSASDVAMVMKLGYEKASNVSSKKS